MPDDVLEPIPNPDDQPGEGHSPRDKTPGEETPVPVPAMPRTCITKSDILWAAVRRAGRTLVYGGGGAIILREVGKHLPAQFGPLLEIAGAMLGVGADKAAREATRCASGADTDWPVYLLGKAKEAFPQKGGLPMKPINYLVILDLAFTIVATLWPDFPKAEAGIAITNSVTVILYLIHKLRPAAK